MAYSKVWIKKGCVEAVESVKTCVVMFLQLTIWRQ